MIDLEDIDFETFSNWHPAVQIVAIIVSFLVLAPLLFGIFASISMVIFFGTICVGIGLFCFTILEIVDRYKLKKDIDNLTKL